MAKYFYQDGLDLREGIIEIPPTSRPCNGQAPPSMLAIPFLQMIWEAQMSNETARVRLDNALLVHVHIPKAGGTTIENILELSLW